MISINFSLILDIESEEINLFHIVKMNNIANLVCCCVYLIFSSHLKKIKQKMPHVVKIYRSQYSQKSVIKYIYSTKVNNLERVFVLGITLTFIR